MLRRTFLTSFVGWLPVPEWLWLSRSSSKPSDKMGPISAIFFKKLRSLKRVRSGYRALMLDANAELILVGPDGTSKPVTETTNNSVESPGIPIVGDAQGAVTVGNFTATGSVDASSLVCSDFFIGDGLSGTPAKILNLNAEGVLTADRNQKFTDADGSIPALPVYANNAAAVSGGLSAGVDIYWDSTAKAAKVVS